MDNQYLNSINQVLAEVRQLREIVNAVVTGNAPKYLTEKEAMEVFKVGRSTLRKYRLRGDLKVWQVGRTVRYPFF